MSHGLQTLKNIGAVCVFNYEDSTRTEESPDDQHRYKIIYTKNCVSQIHKHYSNQSQKIQVHLYKYCSKTDVQKIRELLKLFKIEGENNKYWYFISLDELFDHLLQHFEPDLAI